FDVHRLALVGVLQRRVGDLGRLGVLGARGEGGEEDERQQDPNNRAHGGPLPVRAADKGHNKGSSSDRTITMNEGSHARARFTEFGPGLGPGPGHGWLVLETRAACASSWTACR